MYQGAAFPGRVPKPNTTAPWVTQDDADAWTTTTADGQSRRCSWAGSTAASESAPASFPLWPEDKTLTFHATFKESVPLSPTCKESVRTRHVQILYFTRDGSLQVWEPPCDAKGLVHVQGALLKRRVVPRLAMEMGSHGADGPVPAAEMKRSGVMMGTTTTSNRTSIDSRRGSLVSFPGQGSGDVRPGQPADDANHFTGSDRHWQSDPLSKIADYAVTWKDIKVGGELPLYGRVYSIHGCDATTRSWCEDQGGEWALQADQVGPRIRNTQMGKTVC